MKIPDDIPHIQAQCSHCGFLFDLKFGTSCPACTGIGVKWARLVTEQEAQKYGSDARMRLRTALDNLHRLTGALVEAPNTFEQRSIAECEAIYALDNEGSIR